MEKAQPLVADGRLDPAEVMEDRSFEEFVRAEHGRLYGALCLIAGDRHEAEDIMQDAFVRLLERWDRVQRMDDATGYLYRTAMNVFRRRRTRAAMAIRRAVTFAPHEDSFAAVEDREIVFRALAAIPMQQRAALVVTALLGYSSEEAGRILGLRASTVRARATRARATLRGMIGDEA